MVFRGRESSSISSCGSSSKWSASNRFAGLMEAPRARNSRGWTVRAAVGISRTFFQSFGGSGGFILYVHSNIAHVKRFRRSGRARLCRAGERALDIYQHPRLRRSSPYRKKQNRDEGVALTRRIVGGPCRTPVLFKRHFAETPCNHMTL